jgi:hypothetical protein
MTTLGRMRVAAVLLAAAVAAAVAVVGGSESSDAPRYRAPRLPRQVTVWAVGDAAGPNRGARRVARLVRRGRPHLLLYLGDVYPLGTREDFRRRYAPLFGTLARRTAPTPGNHEWPRARGGYFPYWRRALGRPLPAYYAFSAGGWRILSLNSELRGAARERQLRWLRRRLRRPGTCRLAFWHRPRRSAGLHGDAPDLEALWRALRGRVRLVVNGHDHDLERMRRRNGITAFVAGAGGEGRYALHRDPDVAFGSDSTDGALRLRLAPGAARFAFVSAGGRVLDRGRVRCRVVR